ncbi:MAG TPA: glycine cleavage T C-terminal barrel domain-containing protein [Vicinamibacterales bacterium]|nr:glycine cleavage T C-terminal barrel domain-containing protein [Vicinamibacterales bacterium]
MFSLDEYRAAQAGGGVVRRVDRGVLAVAGADRASWLQGLLTNDVESLGVGESRYSAYLTPQGRMIADMNVVNAGDRILLDVPAPLATSLREKLDVLIFSEDASVTDESDRLLVWTVVTAGAFIDVVAASLPEKFVELPQIDPDTFEVIRIERGVPRFLADMNEDTIPLEAGIEQRAISFTKGCYVGQEVIVRVTTRGGGRVAKKLVRWTATPDAQIVPLPDARIVSADAAAKDIGRVTSAAFSPGRDRVVGLGYVHRDSAAAGTAITLLWNDARVDAVVQP